MIPGGRWAKDYGTGAADPPKDPPPDPLARLTRRYGGPRGTEAVRSTTDLPTAPAVHPFVDRSAELGVSPVPVPRPRTLEERAAASLGPGVLSDATAVTTDSDRLLAAIEAIKAQSSGTIGTNAGGDLGHAGAMREGARQEAVRRDWENKPGALRHAVAASEGVIEGVTAGHPEILLSDDKLAAFREAPLSGTEQAVRVAGFLGGATGTIASQNAIVSGVARALPLGERVRRAAEAVRAGSQAGGGAVLRTAAEGVPYDLALPAEDAGDRLRNAALGMGGAVLANRLPGGMGADPVRDVGKKVAEQATALPAPDLTPPGAGAPAISEAALRSLQEITERTRSRSPASGVQGGAAREIVGTAGGAVAGGTVGGLMAGEDSRAAGATTGALVGARLGFLAGKGRGGADAGRPQLAASDPDVRKVLSVSATPQASQSKIGRVRSALAGIPEAARSAYQDVLDDVYSARRFGREVGGTEEVSVEAARSRGWRGWADELIGVRPRPTGSRSTAPTLRGAVEAARGMEGDVVALSRAERALELARNGMDDKGVDLRAAQATVQKLGGDPAVRGAADQLRRFYRHLLDLRHRNGLLTDEAYQEIVGSGEYYVPFVRAADETARTGSSGGKQFNRSSGVRRMKEGKAEGAIVDPFEQAVLDAQATARDVSRQRVFNVVSRIVEENPDAAAEWIRPVAPRFLGKTEEGRAMLSAPFGKEGRVIQAIVGGKPKYYEVVDDDLYESLASLAPGTQGVFHRLVDVFSLPARGLRAGVTSMPAFGAANAQRDAFFTSLAYRFPGRQTAAGAALGGTVGAATDDDSAVEGFLQGAGFGAGLGVMAPHGARIANGLRHIVGNDDTYQAFLREGGAGTGFFAPDLKTAGELVDRMRREGISARDIYHPRSWWDALQTLNRAIEEAPRVARFEDALRGGAAPGEAAVAGREVSLDFARGGAETQEIRKLRAFWNPMVQGMDKLRSTLNPRTNPNAYLVGLAGMTAPTVALWSINKDDPTYWQQPLWIRNTNWLVPAGQHEDGSTRFLYIPKPFEVGYLFASLPERGLDFAYQRDPERATEALRHMLGETFGELMPVPTAAEPIIETQMAGEGGWDNFRQRPVVGYELQGVPSREQYNNETSSLALGLSRAAELGSFGLVQPSPEKIDHVIEGYTGTLGRSANEAVSKVARATGLDDRPDPSRHSRSQWARFVSRPGGFSTDDVDTMFRRLERADRHREQYERLLDAGDIDAAERYAGEHADDLQMAAELKAYVADFRKLARQRREIEGDPTLSQREKEEWVALLGKQAQDLAALAVGPTPAPTFDGPLGNPLGRRGSYAAPSTPQVDGPEQQQKEGDAPAGAAQKGKSRWSKDYGGR